LSLVTINKLARASQVDVVGGLGGSAAAGTGNGNGGNSGSVGKITINDSVSDGFSLVSVRTDVAGQGNGTGNSGNSGSVTNVSPLGPQTNSQVSTADAPSDPVQGGNAGSIANVSGSVGKLRIDAGDGGAGTGPSGTGGKGGTITGVNIPSVGDFVRWIMAG